MIDLSPHHLETVKRILAEHVPDCEVRAFGSRATWTAWEYSDLDLAVVSHEPLDRRTNANLREALEESDLPIRVDVVEWATLTDGFRQAIEGDCVVVQEPVRSSGWREYTIGEIADVVGGGTPSTKNPDNFTGDIPWLTPKDLSGPHDRSIGRGARNLSQRGLDSSSARLLPPGSVLLSTRAPIGYVALAKNAISTNQGFRSLVMHDGFSAEYLYYWLITNTEELERHASGSTFRELSGSALKMIRLKLPPPAEQRRIAHILGTLDDKIELNRRMSQTLKAMAQALFKSWFIDFDPVRAKAAGLPTGLPSEVDELFSDSFQSSELGEIPAGWQVGRLGDVVQTFRGRSYRSAELTESDTALVTLKSFARGGGYRPDGLKPYAGKHKPDQVVEPGELVIACTDVTQAAEVIGRPAVVQRDQRFRTLVASLDTMIIRARDSAAHPIPFLYGVMSTAAFKHHTYSHVTGTTVLHLKKSSVPEFRFPMPPLTLIQYCDELASAASNRIGNAATDSDTLAVLRNELIPKLLSGSRRVTGANEAPRRRSDD